jgi:GH43 family beta-xylosidase
MLACTLLLTMSTFTNPVLPTGADPQAFFHHGEYFAITSLGESLVLYRTKDLTALGTAAKRTIWTAPPNTDHSRNLWAPEIHLIDGKWYVYYAADDGNNVNHRMFVLENPSADPFEGKFQLKARLKSDPNDNWGIDGTVLSHRGALYYAWSGWPVKTVTTETACIYFAKMDNPWTIGSARVMLSQPEFPWERHWRNPPEWRNGPTTDVFVNEGPAFLLHGDKIFLSYSASGCWTPHYCLGLLTADANADLLDPKSWTKSPTPVFQASAADHVFGPGHNSFFKSPDGKEDWFFYHANDNPNECGGALRSPRIQRLRWNADGTPNFGVPIPTHRAIPKPSGS